MVNIGKYTSRRSRVLKSGGALKPIQEIAHVAEKVVSNGRDQLTQYGQAYHNDEPYHIHDQVRDNARAALNEAHKAIQHPLEHHPEDLIQEAQKHIETAPHIAHEIINRARFIPSRLDFAPKPPSTRFGDKSYDYMAHAYKVKQMFGGDQHVKTHHRRVAGALDFKSVFHDTTELATGFNPADSAGKAMNSFNKINLHNTSMRGIAKNALHGYAGNLRAHAAYAQTTGLMLTPGVALGAAVPMAGLAATGQAFRGYADGVDAVNRRI